MECFIKKIWKAKGEQAHVYFVRFGKGKYENRAALNLQKTSKVKLRGSYEWVNDFVNLVSELENVKFSGVILSKEPLSLENEKKKSGIFEYSTSIDSGKVKEIQDKVYAMLLDAESPGLSLKMKKKLPKPGKSGDAKIDDKFCQLEADLKYWPEIKDAFMLPECKKCKLSHIYVIDELILPEGEKDFAKIRELTKRKGKIIRKSEIDGKEEKEEKEFEA